MRIAGRGPEIGVNVVNVCQPISLKLSSAFSNRPLPD